jgi:hypothetical protein
MYAYGRVSRKAQGLETPATLDRAEESPKVLSPRAHWLGFSGLERRAAVHMRMSCFSGRLKAGRF